MQKLIPFKALHNFRDLGGYKTTCGGIVKYGQFYRSGMLCFMKEESDFKLFDSLKIKVICDFRTPNEREKRPDPVFEGVKRLDICALPKYDLDRNYDFTDFISMSREELITIIREPNKNYYGMAFGNKAFKAMFQEIMNNNVPLLMHCTAGKDRTGVASSLLLSFLGVPREVAIEDYMASNKFRKAAVEHQRRAHGKAMGDKADLIAQLTAVRKFNIDIIFNEIDEKYGNINKYFEQEYGLGILEREEARRKFLA